MELIVINNWSGGPGKLLITKNPVPLQEGDNYISDGFSGKNIFTCYGQNVGRLEIKVVAKTSDLEWNYSGNNTLKNLQTINL